VNFVIALIGDRYAELLAADERGSSRTPLRLGAYRLIELLRCGEQVAAELEDPN
jgi:hypothetical protein